MDPTVPSSLPLPMSASPAPVEKKRGRPRKISRMTIEQAEEQIAHNLPVLIERLMDLAQGVVVVEYKAAKDTGEITERIYRVPPDKDALKYLTERVLGRVPQRMEITGKDGEAVKIMPWLPHQEAAKRGLVEKIEDITSPEQRLLLTDGA